MKLPSRLIFLFALSLLSPLPAAAQTLFPPPTIAFTPTPVPVPFVTATDAVLFAMGFLSAEQSIQLEISIPRVPHTVSAQLNRNNGHLLAKFGLLTASLYFYGRAYRYEWAAFEAGESR